MAGWFEDGEWIEDRTAWADDDPRFDDVDDETRLDLLDAGDLARKASREDPQPTSEVTPT